MFPGVTSLYPIYRDGSNVPNWRPTSAQGCFGETYITYLNVLELAASAVHVDSGQNEGSVHRRYLAHLAEAC